MNELLKKLGLNHKEAKAFLKLMELGAQPVSAWAKQCGVPRPTMYLVLESLKAKRLIEVFERFGITYARTLAAAELENVLNQQAAELEQTRSLLKQSLPELEKLENRLSLTPTVKFHEGAKAVAQMYEQIISQGHKEFCAMFSPEALKTALPKYFDLIPEQLVKRKTKMREIITDSITGRQYQESHQSKQHLIKRFPAGVDFPADTILVPNQVFLIAYGQNQITATEINSSAIYQAQKTIFEELWRQY